LLAAVLPEPVWGAQPEHVRETASLPSLGPVPGEKHARKVPLWGKLFIGLVVVSLISYIARVTWVEHDFRCQQGEFTKYQHARPSLENLPPVVPMPDEQAVILHPIAGRTAQLRSRFNNAAIGNAAIGYQAASVIFAACYTLLPRERCEGNPEVEVQVSQWPNSLWSAYELQGIQYRLGAGCSTLPKRIQKFGNAVMADANPKDPGKGKFYWTSGNVLVVIDSYISNSNDFIRSTWSGIPAHYRLAHPVSGKSSRASRVTGALRTPSGWSATWKESCTRFLRIPPKHY